MRGLFTAGVLDVMMENSITFDGTVGVSAGAAFGCNYKSGQIGRVLRYNTRFCRDKRYSGLYSLLTDGNIFSTSFCYGDVQFIHDPLDFEAYEKDPMEFYVVCTDIEKGTPFYHRFDSRKDHGLDWIRASASMPLVSKIVEIDGMKLLDGGVTDPIPVRFFESIGYDRCVAVLTQPMGYRKEKNKLLPLMRLKYRRYPALVDAAAKRHILYNETLDHTAKLEHEGRLFVIRPKAALPVGKVEKDPDKLRAAYDLGREAAEERLAELVEYLNA